MKQKQSQKVVVNIGTGGTRRRRRRGRKAPSSQVNIQPIVLPPQTDYTPILTAMLNHQTNSIRPPPIPQNTPTPVSLSSSQPASVMAGESAIRRAGRTADTLQPHPSVASGLRTRSADTYVTERLVDPKKGQGESGGGPPMLIGAKARAKRGPIPFGIQQAQPLTDRVDVGIPLTEPSDPTHATGRLQYTGETVILRRRKKKDPNT